MERRESAISSTLDPRQEQILALVVEEYVNSASPVGSRAVVKKGIKRSPASVRAEMARLEDLGLLEQPHPSAGRRPTDRGFRYYVERLLETRWPLPPDRAELDALRERAPMTGPELIVRTAALLERLSGSVAMVMVMPIERSTIKSVHFLELGRDRIRAVFQLAGRALEERVIENRWALDRSALTKLSNLINHLAPGLTLTELRRELIKRREEAKAQADLLLARAVELSEELSKDRRPELLIRGQANLFDLPEFAEIGTVKEMVRTLEEQSLLIEMLEQVSMATGVRVIIGEENKIEMMKRCSVIAGAYGRGEMTVGAIGLMGPTRMDYARLIPVVRYASELVSDRLQR